MINLGKSINTRWNPLLTYFHHYSSFSDKIDYKFKIYIRNICKKTDLIIKPIQNNIQFMITGEL